MLWRFLLVAIAVSCTLSRTHAHGPRDRIKDLMCVLLLSGMQKEDLDVSMLNKLQRYNVNIHDTNNEDLLQECMTLRNKSIRDKINTTLNNGDGATNGVLFQEDKNSSQTLPNPIHPDIQTVNNKKETNNDSIQYIDGKPKLDSVLKFWQDMKSNKETTASQSNKEKNTQDNGNINEKYITEPKNKRNVNENSDSNEEDDIKKLLENYFSKRQHNKKKHSNKRLTTTSKSVDNIYKELIQSQRTNKNENLGIVRYLPYTVPVDGKPIYDNFSGVLGDFNRFNIENEGIKQISKQNRRLSYNPYLRNLMDVKMVSTTEREIQQKFSNDMIKEIANSVKEIVLKDLKLKIEGTTTLRTSSITPTTTVITKATSSSKQDNLKIQESILNKFLAMFEEIKSLKKNTLLISDKVNKEDVQELSPINLKLKRLTAIEPQKPMYNNPYQVQYPKVYSQNLNFFAQEHKFKSNNPVFVKTAPKPLIPRMFQTNNLEIPPLGIPIDKPLNPINQNIIVTSEIPYRIGVIQQNNLRPRNNPYANLNKLTEHISKQSHTLKSSGILNIPTSYESRITQNIGAPQYYKSYYDKIRLNNYHPRSDNVEHIRTPELPRFHERLENMDFLDDPNKKRINDRMDCCDQQYMYSKPMVECCDRKIASRQQMSLNNMKNGSYDDTHFKNFIKSQQKVTDMLEKILATRDVVRSTEAI